MALQVFDTGHRVEHHTDATIIGCKRTSLDLNALISLRLGHPGNTTLTVCCCFPISIQMTTHPSLGGTELCFDTFLPATD